MSSVVGQRPSLIALLRRPRYPGFVLTVSLSRVAGTMFTTAGVLLVLGRTGNASLAGVTAAAAVLPGALTGPVLGAWLDVASRRRVLIVTDQLLSVAGLVGILLLAGRAPNWTVPAVAVLYSVTRPFSAGTFSSALVEVVGPELLDAASSIEASSLNLSFVIGPALAGGIAGAASPAVAIDVQIALTVVVAALIAVNTVFEVRPEERAASVRHAVRDGMRALARNPTLRAVGAASTLAVLGWGLMVVGFPIYAARLLHAGAHASGYLWAGLATGSIIGTFLFRGAPSLRRVAMSYGVLGCSALLWPLVHALWLGILLITVTGVLEGPAYSGTIALRQRHAPAAQRAQTMTSLASFALVASAVGSTVGGLVNSFTPLVFAFFALNLVAALVAVRAGASAGPR